MNLKPAGHCKKVAKKATMVLNQIPRNCHYRDRHKYVGLYKQYIRPHLEFASPAWSPWTQEDIQEVEKVQEKALRQVNGLRGNTCRGGVVFVRK